MTTIRDPQPKPLGLAVGQVWRTRRDRRVRIIARVDNSPAALEWVAVEPSTGSVYSYHDAGTVRTLQERVHFEEPTDLVERLGN